MLTQVAANLQRSECIPISRTDRIDTSFIHKATRLVHMWLSANAISRCRALIRGIIQSRLDYRYVTLVSSDLDCSCWKSEVHMWRSHFGDYEIWFSVPGIHHLTWRALIHKSCADHRLRHTKTIYN
jgi:hypothetical protein